MFRVFIYHITKFENHWKNDTLIIKITVMDEAQNFIKSNQMEKSLYNTKKVIRKYV
jgi:hypothetical protein